jgi:hypothetical protein
VRHWQLGAEGGRLLLALQKLCRLRRVARGQRAQLGDAQLAEERLGEAARVAIRVDVDLAAAVVAEAGAAVRRLEGVGRPGAVERRAKAATADVAAGAARDDAETRVVRAEVQACEREWVAERAKPSEQRAMWMSSSARSTQARSAHPRPARHHEEARGLPRAGPAEDVIGGPRVGVVVCAVLGAVTHRRARAPLA